jgi:hypothetical protein
VRARYFHEFTQCPHAVERLHCSCEGMAGRWRAGKWVVRVGGAGQSPLSNQERMKSRRCVGRASVSGKMGNLVGKLLDSTSSFFQ